MKYKINEIVIYTDKKNSYIWKWWKGISLYKKIAKIISIEEDEKYLLEFKDCVDGEEKGFEKGKKGHCMWCEKDEFELDINHLKFKKWVKG